MPSAASDRKRLVAFCKRAGIDMKTPWSQLARSDREKLWNSKVAGKNEFYGVVGLFDYLETKKYKMHVRVFIAL